MVFLKEILEKLILKNQTTKKQEKFPRGQRVKHLMPYIKKINTVELIVTALVLIATFVQVKYLGRF